jgi:glycosyltransferase involved in cell wall biosynthesis
VKAEIVCSSRELFGADRCAVRLAEVLGVLGADVTLVLPAQRPEAGLAAEAARRGITTDVRPVAIASSGGVEAASALRPGGRRDARPDLTVLNSTAVLGTSGMARKRVLMLREWLEPSSPKHRALALWHRRRLDAAVGISTGVLEQWRACVRGPRRQALIPDWLDDDAIPATPKPADARSGIVCLGRFNQWKGQGLLAEAFVDAFGAAPESRPPLTFVGAQPGTPFAAEAERIAARGADSGWEVLPFDSDPEPYLERAALLVLPSLHPEPFGMVVLEALSLGCRVLAFPGGGPSDLIGPFEHALDVVARDQAALASGLRRWWDAGGRAQDPGEWAKTLDVLRSGWSPMAAAERWRPLLDGLRIAR